MSVVDTAMMVMMVAEPLAGLAEKGAVKVMEMAVEKSAAKEAGEIAEKSAQLIEQNGGRNSVTMSSEVGKTRVDLAGKTHYSKETGENIPTPHVQDYKANVIPAGPRAGEIGSFSKAGDVRPATMEDLSKVEDFLNSIAR